MVVKSLIRPIVRGSSSNLRRTRLMNFSNHQILSHPTNVNETNLTSINPVNKNKLFIISRTNHSSALSSSTDSPSPSPSSSSSSSSTTTKVSKSTLRTGEDKQKIYSTRLINDPNQVDQAPTDGIKLTSSAIEQIERVRKKDNKPNEVLRLSIESGGCHGFQYKMEFTESIEPEDDLLFSIKERTDDENGLIVIDKSSIDLLKNSTLDFQTELIGSSFKVLDNPQSSGKGCGCGVSWELKF